MPTGATRLRRDFVSLICLVRAHAILYQAQRERDHHGRIIGTVDGDYEPVRDLVAALIAEGVEASVPERTRETVEAVRNLIDDGEPHPSPKAITDVLEIGRSASYDRIRDALRRGFLVNLAQKSEGGMKLALGAELPAAGEDFLPSAEAIVRSLSESPFGRHSGSTIDLVEGLSGCPDDPEDVREPDQEEVERLAELARATIAEAGS